MRRIALVLLGMWYPLACGGETTRDGQSQRDAAAHGDAGAGELAVEIGTADLQTLDFLPLEPGGDIPLGTFGQGGTHAVLAIRCVGFGTRAFVDVTLVNLDSDASVMTPVSIHPALLLCRGDAGVCDDLPIYLMTGGLADPDKKDGLHVQVTADVHNDGGQMGSASVDGVLRKNF